MVHFRAGVPSILRYSTIFPLHFFAVAKIRHLLPDCFVKYENYSISLFSLANFGTFIRNIAQINQNQLECRKIPIGYLFNKRRKKPRLIALWTANLEHDYKNGWNLRVLNSSIEAYAPHKYSLLEDEACVWTALLLLFIRLFIVHRLYFNYMHWWMKNKYEDERDINY